MRTKKGNIMQETNLNNSKHSEPKKRPLVRIQSNRLLSVFFISLKFLCTFKKIVNKTCQFFFIPFVSFHFFGVFCNHKIIRKLTFLVKYNRLAIIPYFVAFLFVFIPMLLKAESAQSFIDHGERFYYCLMLREVIVDNNVTIISSISNIMQGRSKGFIKHRNIFNNQSFFSSRNPKIVSQQWADKANNQSDDTSDSNIVMDRRQDINKFHIEYFAALLSLMCSLWFMFFLR